MQFDSLADIRGSVSADIAEVSRLSMVTASKVDETQQQLASLSSTVARLTQTVDALAVVGS